MFSMSMGTITLERFITATRQQLTEPLDGARERLAADLRVRTEWLSITPKGNGVLFILVQPEVKTIRLFYRTLNSRPQIL